MRQNDRGMRKGFSRTCKKERISLKCRRPHNVVSERCDLKPASLFSSTFPVWFETLFMKKMLIKDFNILK